ncbi:enediyne antibiotic chromoprotein [Nocardia sp. NBC_01499]|uniref:enediyne antibiotic chromoprotein n=1 Tax=Nocardia sp. NBC_01499 TaxID=2903597 RepID=UPI00386AFA19
MKKVILASTLILLATPLGTGLSAAPARAEAAPSISATPSSDLSDGDTITVTASGFDPNTKIYVGECAILASDTLGCNVDDAKIVKPDGAGNASIPIVVRRSFDARDHNGNKQARVDCPTVVNGCMVAAGNDDHDRSADQSARAPISFR